MSIWKSKYFCGKELREYELKEGYISYKTLASTFDAVLCNEIISKTWGVVGEWEQENGGNDEDFKPEIFQYFIITDEGADILKAYTNEIVYYNSDLDIYVWGVTHFGTSWDYVNTSIKIELENEEV